MTALFNTDHYGCGS